MSSKYILTKLDNKQLVCNKPIIFDATYKYIKYQISNKLLNKVIYKLILLRDNKINKVVFKNLNKKEQWAVYQICGKLGLFYSSFNNKWSGIVSPIITRSFNPKMKEILIHLTHTPKCGGMFIKSILSKLNQKNIINYFPKHYTIKSSKGFIIKIVNGHVPIRNFSDKVIRVGFSRDPTTRFNSAYSYIKDGASDRSFKKNEFKKWFGELNLFSSPNKFLKNEFSMNYFTSYQTGILHFYSLTYWIGDDYGNCMIDYCLRQEHLQNDWKILCNILGITEYVTLKKVNITKKKNKIKINKNLIKKYYPYDYELNKYVNDNHKLMTNNLKHKLKKIVKNIID